MLDNYIQGLGDIIFLNAARKANDSVAKTGNERERGKPVSAGRDTVALTMANLYHVDAGNLVSGIADADQQTKALFNVMRFSSMDESGLFGIDAETRGILGIGGSGLTMPGMLGGSLGDMTGYVTGMLLDRPGLALLAQGNATSMNILSIFDTSV